MSERKTADVSIIVANYNNGAYLDDFMRSIMKSTVEPLELILVDDGSTDDSIEVLRQYQHLNYLKIIRFDSNRGFTAALNEGLDAAKGSYIMRADPDDMILPQRIELQYDFMIKHPQVDILGANVIYFNDRLKKNINKSNFPVSHEKIVRAYRRGEHGLLHATVIAKAEIYLTYRYQDIFPSEDYELFSRMVRDGKVFANLAAPVNHVRVHEKSSTSKLQYQAIHQTFNFRDRVFGTSTSVIRKYWYFTHIRFYRKYQLSRCPVAKYGNLLLAVITYPAKAFRRLPGRR